jgi:ribosomal protein S18 acetylase RimI-like enzyme
MVGWTQKEEVAEMIVVRLAEEQDRQLLIREYLQHLSPDLEEATRFALRQLQVERTLLADEEGLVVGSLHWGVREGVRQGVAQITGIRVVPSRRRQGVGRMLAERALAEMQEYFRERGSELRRVFCFVQEENEAASGLLAGLGFAAAARVPELFEEGKREVLWVKSTS